MSCLVYLTLFARLRVLYNLTLCLFFRRAWLPVPFVHAEALEAVQETGDEMAASVVEVAGRAHPGAVCWMVFVVVSSGFRRMVWDGGLWWL